jgi:aldose 1-epimerase
MNRRFSQPAATGPLIALRHGDYGLTLAPQFGARIATFRHRERDILRPASPAALADPQVYAFCGFPLMPYSGPIFGGGFQFDHIWHPLKRTVAEEPTATHGEGWIRPWTVVAQGGDFAEMTLDHMPTPGTFPFAWHGRLRFALSEHGLTIAITLACRDRRSMPAGIGFHPYFPKPSGTRLKFAATGVWPPDAPDAVERGYGDLAAGLGFHDGPEVLGRGLDRCFEGWDGHAEVIWPDGARAIVTADGALTRLQIYDAWDYPYLCVEPVSNANDGFNRMARQVRGHGVARLETGEELSGTIWISFGSAKGPDLWFRSGATPHADIAG